MSKCISFKRTCAWIKLQRVRLLPSTFWKVGAGKNSNHDGTITLYPDMCCGDSVDSLMDAIYPGIAEGPKPDAYFKDHTLLSCKNDDVDDLNADILCQVPWRGESLSSQIRSGH